LGCARPFDSEALINVSSALVTMTVPVTPNSIVSPAFAIAIVFRSEPELLSFVLVTVSVLANDGTCKHQSASGPTNSLSLDAEDRADKLNEFAFHEWLLETQ
jgi:hypothetical protein